LREDLYVDSLEMLMIIADLEDELEITIAYDDFADVKCISV
jgi:acyl carrier protein